MAVRGGNRLIEILVAGDIFMDLVLGGFAAWPSPGTEVFAENYRREVGGGAAITACGLVRLGSRASVLSVVGQDYGAWISQRLESFGVDTSRLCIDETEPTAISVAVSTAQDRTYLTYTGANKRFAKVLGDAAHSGTLAQTRHFHLGWAPPLDTAAELLEELRRYGCTVSLDCGWYDDWLSDSRAMNLLRQIDIFFPNENEATRMTGETHSERILRAYEAAGARRVALKLGAAGAALLWDGEILRSAPWPAETVDTTGAGDCFDAGFLHYWLRGASPATCLRAANICGAVSTEHFGGVEGFPDPITVERALQASACEESACEK